MAMGPIYGLQLLFVKITELLITQQPLKPEKKVSMDLESQQILKYLNVGLT